MADHALMGTLHTLWSVLYIHAGFTIEVILDIVFYDSE